jgi:hypothetical protein
VPLACDLLSGETFTPDSLFRLPPYAARWLVYGP